jgi:hypothetical protein
MDNLERKANGSISKTVRDLLKGAVVGRFVATGIDGKKAVLVQRFRDGRYQFVGEGVGEFFSYLTAQSDDQVNNGQIHFRYEGEISPTMSRYDHFKKLLYQTGVRRAG